MTEFEDDANSHSASDCMYERHAVGLRAYLIKTLRDAELAEDVLQQTFRKYEEERLKRSDSESDERPLTAGWLYRVAQNEAVQVKRSEKRWTNHKQQLGTFLAQMQSQGRDELVAAEQAQLVRAALERLPAVLRVVVELRVFEDEKFADIAKRLDVPLGTVLSRMNRGLAALRKGLRGLEAEM